jgi:hypothetical protein
MITLMMHARRHGDGIGHVRCCPAQDPANPDNACDQTYDQSVNLSPYGIQYWLQKNWISGYINAGVGCMRPIAKADAIYWMRQDVNFCTNTPPVLNEPSRWRPDSRDSGPTGLPRGDPTKRRDSSPSSFQPGDFVVAVIAFAFFQGRSRACKRAADLLWASRA